MDSVAAALVNSGAVITAVGTTIVAILTILGGWFVKKGDRNAKLTQRYFDDSEFNVKMVNAVRVDYWQLFGWASIVSSKWHVLIEGLPRVCVGHEADVQALMREVGDLPAMPEAHHLKVERERLRANFADDEKG